jgi:ElaB/YqjD/DUF883 family membrane-anchored ribosome-binding protein
MPDPLLNEDFGDVESRSASGTGTTTAYQAPLEDPIRKGELDPNRELPESGNSRLNRTAEQVGGAIGTVVSQAKRLPNSARRGLHLVRDRAQDLKGQTADQISGSASSLASNAQGRMRELGNRAEQRAGEWMDAAEERGRALLDKADQITSRLADRGSELKAELDARTRELRDDARVKAAEVRLRSRQLVQERPLECLGCIAGAAFIVGVALRIVRSRNASGY